MTSASMRALRAHRRGGSQVLTYEDAPRPQPGPGDIVIAAEAVGITFAELDWDLTWQTRAGADRTPTIPGHAVVGTRVPSGNDAFGVPVGRRLVGLVPFDRDGAAAEEVALPAAGVVAAPRTWSAVEAASLPLAALTAWQALVDHARVEPGERVVVLGGAGAVGVFVVQLAVALGATALATASTAHADVVRELGASEVIDVNSTDLADRVADVDVVIDAVGGELRDRSFRVLRLGGRLVSLGGPPPDELARGFGVEATFFVVEPDHDELVHLCDLADSGVLRPVVSEVFPLARGREAYGRRGAPRPPGTTVLTVP